MTNSKLAAELRTSYENCKSWPEDTPSGQVALLEIRNMVPDILAALQPGGPVSKPSGLPPLEPAGGTMEYLPTLGLDESANVAEAFALLALIDMTFQTDPRSVQCFDLRIVDRVRRCVERHQKNG